MSQEQENKSTEKDSQDSKTEDLPSDASNKKDESSDDSEKVDVKDDKWAKYMPMLGFNKAEQVTGLKSKSNGFLPLAELSVDADIIDSIAVIKMIQVYVNPLGAENSENAPIEVTFQFPKEAESVISKMMLTVGSKTIEAKIMENEKAEQKYDDQIAKGNVAALLKKSKNSFDLH